MDAPAKPGHDEVVRFLLYKRSQMGAAHGYAGDYQRNYRGGGLTMTYREMVDERNDEIMCDVRERQAHVAAMRERCKDDPEG